MKWMMLVQNSPPSSMYNTFHHYSDKIIVLYLD